MEEKPNALRLADVLEISINHGIRREAAAELRRLHEAHDWQHRMAGDRLRRVEKLEAQRDALLETLRRVMRHIPADAGGASLSDDMHRARKAIARATSED